MRCLGRTTGVVALLVPVVFVVSWLGAVRARAADALTSAVDVARVMVSGAETADNGGRRLVLNGARFVLDVHSEASLPEAILEATVERCVEAAFGERWWRALAPDPVLRLENRRGGAVACLLPASPWKDVASIAAALDRVVEGSRIDEAGAIDVTLVEPSEDGAVVTRLTSEGAVSLDRMFPREGDAAGVDPTGLPRPPASRRVLTAGAEGTEPALAGYETSVPWSDVVAWYRQRLPQNGWEVSGPGVAQGDTVTVAARRGDGLRLVSVRPGDEGSAVALIRLR